jgi:hypothetical protein
VDRRGEEEHMGGIVFACIASAFKSLRFFVCSIVYCNRV